MASPRPKPLTPKEKRAQARARADAAHDKYVQRTYGLAPGEYQRMLEAQEHRCAMCSRLARRRRLAVDHDHNTGRVRGLLCYLCNKYLGQWEGDPIAAHNASVYLASVAADYGPEYEPLRTPLVEAERPARRLLPLSVAPARG